MGLAFAFVAAIRLRTWLFDSNPTITTGAGGVGDVLAILEDAARDQVYSTTKAAVALSSKGPAARHGAVARDDDGEGRRRRRALLLRPRRGEGSV